MGGSWHVVIDDALPGFENMARDEAILEAVAARQCGPVLRLYRWASPCLSLGYAQPFFLYVDAAFCERARIRVVRRPTGGRAVLHHMELTYAAVFPVAHPALGGSVLESFLRVSLPIVDALKRVGVRAELVPARRGAPQLKAGNCFVAASAYEVGIDGRKLVGSAQVRRQGAVLQHGSILLDVVPWLWEGAFADGSGRDLSTLITLRSSGFEGSLWDLSAALIDSFTAVMGGEPLVVPFTKLNIAPIDPLRKKHCSLEWLHRR